MSYFTLCADRVDQWTSQIPPSQSITVKQWRNTKRENKGLQLDAERSKFPSDRSGAFFSLCM